MGEIAGIYALEAPFDLTAKLVVTDRFGREYDIDDRDVSPYIEGGYLKTEQLTGTYELNAQKISHHCGGH
ncbi:hypothetical protein FORC37_1415 [Vibrio vulnificus]|nr:hypothetical protein FORC37_1415 [Vibrio vulnificus]